jgi:hypothetical protein
MNTLSRFPVSLVLSAFALCSPLATAQVVETHAFNALNKGIPDGNASGLSELRVVSSAIAELSSLRVRLRIQGEFNGDLYGYLRHVSSNVTNFCVLLNRPGKTTGSAAGYNDSGFDITLDQAAANGDVHIYREILPPLLGQALTGVWQPDGRKVDPVTVSASSPRTTTLSSFAGAPATGEWTLFLADLEAGGTNLLESWELEFSGIAVPEVGWPTPPDIIYGTALGAPQLNASSPVPGVVAYNPAAGTVLNAGEGQILSVTFTPLDPLTYVAVTTNVAINVLKKPLTVTANDATRVYGAPEVLTASFNGLVNGDTAESLDTPPIIVSDATPSSPIGSYPITASGAADVNYAISFVPGTLTITRASTVGSLTSSANPAVLGEQVTFTFTVTAVAPSTAIPVGNVMFSVDGISTSAPLVNGVATLTVSTLSAGSHTVLAEYQGTPNFFGTGVSRLSPDQVINTPPIARADELRRYLPYGAKVKVAFLLSNDSDADGDALSFIGPSPTSQNGGLISRDGDWIFYAAPSGFTNDDSFTYTITDGSGQPVSGTVSVRVQPDPLPSPNLNVTDLGNGSYRIRFDGIPELTYRVEYAESLSPAVWQALATEMAGPTGLFEIVDTPPVGFGQRFYRSVYP